MQDVVESQVTGAQQAVTENMRVRITAFTRDRIDAFHMLRAQAIQHIVDQTHTFILPNAGLQKTIEFIISCIHHRASHAEQGDLILRLDHARFLHQLLTVHNGDAFFLKRE